MRARSGDQQEDTPKQLARTRLGERREGEVERGMREEASGWKSQTPSLNGGGKVRGVVGQAGPQEPSKGTRRGQHTFQNEGKTSL